MEIRICRIGVAGWRQRDQAASQMKHGFFVTGTDTGVGKTLISSALVHYFAQSGLRVAGMKPVAAGCERVGAHLLSEDVASLRDAGNVDIPLEVINPYAFEPPLAPHIAAEAEGVRIELTIIHEAFKKAADTVDILVVEGVGGFRVPLNDQEDTADLACRLGLPIILVVGLRLGCLNHALLTAESIVARGLKLAGWVANCIDPEMEMQQENLAALGKRISAPCLGVVSYQSVADFNTVAMAFDTQEIRNLVCA
ncbi:MAG: dethiobiotin synthase [Methylophilaceae bacterium]